MEIARVVAPPLRLAWCPASRRWGRRKGRPPCPSSLPGPRHDHAVKRPGGEAAGGRSVNGAAPAPAPAPAEAPAKAPQRRQRRGPHDVEDEAWGLLRESVVRYCGSPVGTIAACDPNDASPLNYDQVFIRDFVPSGIAFLLKGDYEIVRNFILHTLQLQVITRPFVSQHSLLDFWLGPKLSKEKD
jgi:hypothetical protein